MVPLNRTKSLPFDQRRLTATSLAALPSADSGQLHFLYPRGMHGLGDWLSDIESQVTGSIETDAQTAITQAQAGIAQAQNAADPVPFQNAITNSILAPVSNALQIPAVQTSIPSLQALAALLNQGLTSMNQWVAAHPSSRANGMVQTLMPYFDGLAANIQSKLAALGSTSNVIPGTNIALNTNPLANITSNPTLMIGLAVLAYFVFIKK